jgi:mRNA interferase MazF
MTIYESFSVVDVPFPFIDSARRKTRPALVLSNSLFQNTNSVLVLAMITSAERSSWEYDIVITDWRVAGLRKSCVLRWKLFTLDATLVAGFRGRLSDPDRAAVINAFSEIFTCAQ